MQNAGFVNCDQKVFSTFAVPDAELRKASGHALINGGSQSMHGIVERGGFDYLKTHDDADRMVNAMRDDVNNGVCELGFEIYWTIGQKPIY